LKTKQQHTVGISRLRNTLQYRRKDAWMLIMTLVEVRVMAPAYITLV